jgi:choline oxidase
MLGGCSSHNSCIAFVPPDSDFERWRADGAAGWGPGEVAPYYERVLSMVALERSDSGNALVAAFLAAAAEAGHPTLDFTRQLGAGAGWFRLNKRGMARASSSAAYLHPLEERSPTLTVHTGTRARRLVLDAGRAVAVETDRGRIGVGREALVCAGAFGTPKLLMLSGLGPASELEPLGIDVAADLPGVGENLQDHPEGVIVWEAARAVPPETANLYEAGLFARVDPDTPFPDLMLHFGTEAFDLQTAPLGYPTASNAFSMTPNVTRSRSRGRVWLRSADPDDDPRIDFRYFQDEGGYDERVLVAGLRLARELAATEPLAPWVARELAPGPGVRSDADLGAYARSTHNTVYHPAGSCRMGAGSEAPVDPELRLRGVSNVRVADASVFPSLVSVNPALTCMMVGEACAERVLAG